MTFLEKGHSPKRLPQFKGSRIILGRIFYNCQHLSVSDLLSISLQWFVLLVILVTVHAPFH